MEQDDQLLNEFVQEAKAHIEIMEAGLLQLEAGQSDDDTLNEVFRAAHSIKGTASFFALDKIVELSHAIENLFGELREHKLTVNADMMDALLPTVDALKNLIDDPLENDKYDIIGFVVALKQFMDQTGRKSAGPAKPPEDSSIWDMWNTLTASPVKPEISLQTVNAAATEPPIQAVHPHENFAKESVRVSVSLLDDLLNIAGEMVLRRNQLLRVTEEIGIDTQLENISHGIDELTTNLQKKVMQTRMQPIAHVFNKFPRIVRDLSRKVGKEVDLVMEGMNVELDRSLLEPLVDPLTHLVRNALDHGIEMPDVRKARNKSVTGTLKFSAYQEGGRVVVDVCDDGGGIDVEKVKDKALQRGLVHEKDCGSLKETDIIQFILVPGFSTAEAVTDISGRGVGMDVVKTNIEKIGGKVEIISEKGVGTTFRLLLPLTLAIISALIVEVKEQLFALPQANLRELILINQENADSYRIEFVHHHPALRLRNQLIPLIKLSDVLQPQDEISEDIAVECFDSDQVLRILIVNTGRVTYGLLVDAVYDMEEILVKPISPALNSNCKLYSGVTVLGDGRIAMILDTERIQLYADLSPREEVLSTSVSKINRCEAEQQYLLLFTCSGGEMLGLDLAMVSRVEEVEVSQLQKIGSKYYYHFHGQTTRVIWPEHYLPISKKRNNAEKCYVILPRLVKYNIGIVAQKICDTLKLTVSLDKDGVCGTGVLGSTSINENIVTLINLHELFREAVPEYNYALTASKNDFEYDSAKQIGQDHKSTILLVEDTLFFSKLVKSYLEGDGYEVVTAENGREAWEKLQVTPVAAVISDIEMPLMDGIELVRTIRANKKLSHLPVIALTSLTGDYNKEKGLRAGFDVYEYKLDRIRLLDTLHKILRAKQG